MNEPFVTSTSSIIKIIIIFIIVFKNRHVKHSFTKYYCLQNGRNPIHEAKMENKQIVFIFYRQLWYVILILSLNNDLFLTSTLSVNTLNLNVLN